MSRTFLQLCQDAISDLGIAGGTINATVGLTSQEQVRMVNWVARADIFVQNLWFNWRFLWFFDTGVTAGAGQDFLTLAPPANADSVDTIDKKSLWVNYGTAQAMQVIWMPWDEFFRLYQTKPKTTMLVPNYFSQDPTGKIWLNAIMQNPTAFALAYWYTGKRMVNATDVSPLPNKFDAIIVERAKLFYAERENATEIMTGSTAEYTDLLDKLQAMYLPNNIGSRFMGNNETTVPTSYVE